MNNKPGNIQVIAIIEAEIKYKVFFPNLLFKYRLELGRLKASGFSSY